MARKIYMERVGENMKVVLTELQNTGGQARLKEWYLTQDGEDALKMSAGELIRSALAKWS